MPGTTAAGSPYALPEDPLVQWPATSQSVAARIDTVVGPIGRVLSSKGSQDATVSNEWLDLTPAVVIPGDWPDGQYRIYAQGSFALAAIHPVWLDIKVNGTSARQLNAVLPGLPSNTMGAVLAMEVVYQKSGTAPVVINVRGPFSPAPVTVKGRDCQTIVTYIGPGVL